MPKFEQDNQKKLLDGCSSTLGIFLVKKVILLFWLDDIIFNTLTKNALKNFKLEKKN